MWYNHLFCQRNKTRKRAVEVEVGGDVEGGREVVQNLKRRGGRQYKGVFIK